jgi:prepilin-type N-terminal cleavage/methylation domain-containing protein
MRPTPVQRGGFTLIELLVVIAIIALLMGLLFPGVRVVMRMAEKANAARTVAALRHAFEVYQQQQAAWPNLTPLTTTATNVAWLVGGNSQKVQYMEIAPKRLDSLTGDLLDPWGNLYQFRFATDYPPTVTGPNGAVKAGCIVWSLGPDKTPGTKDDIRSW